MLPGRLGSQVIAKKNGQLYHGEVPVLVRYPPTIQLALVQRLIRKNCMRDPQVPPQTLLRATIGERLLCNLLLLNEIQRYRTVDYGFP